MAARGRQQPRLGDLIASAYDCALEAEPFATFLPQIAAAIGADTAQLAVWSPELDQGGLAVSWQIPDDLVRAYREHFWKIDVWRIAAEKTVPVGRATAGHRLVPFRDFERCEMYNDALRAYGLYDTCAGIIFARGRSGAGLSLLRARPRPFYGRRELAVMDALLPHLHRAYDLRVRFAQLSAQAEAALGMLDRSAAGAIVLARGRIAHATPGAKRVLDAGTLLYAAGGRLRARAARIDAQLTALTSARAAASGAARIPCVIDVPNERGAPGLRLTILAKGGGHLVPFVHAPVLVVIDEWARSPTTGVGAVATQYGLTPAERRVVAQFVNGATLRETAEQHGLSLHTVRNQMKQVLHKTECRRQVDLFRLCLTRQRGGHAA